MPFRLPNRSVESGTNLAIALICPRAAFGSRTAVSRIPLSETLSPRVTKLRRDISQTADFPGDRYVVSGVMPGGYAYCSPSTPSHGFVDKIAPPARAGAGTDIDWLEQNRAS